MLSTMENPRTCLPAVTLRSDINPMTLGTFKIL